MMIGRSTAFLQLTRLIARLGAYDVPVLIEGETGTGKELAARALHYNSRRRAFPFVPVNCGAIPDALLESELFGHRRGAFTDARDDQPGLVVLAQHGTLFLDEVDAISPKGQVVLLRFLQDQEYRPLGGRTLLQADVRVIAASNKNLDHLSASGALREDLVYRLKLMYLRVPPLREREGDAALLANHFVTAASVRFEQAPKVLTRESLEWLDGYEWPGNVRELEHLIYREFLLTDGSELSIRPPAPLGIVTADDSGLTYRQAKMRAIERFERQFLTKLMARAQGSVSTAARLVHTERRHLGRLLKRYGIDKTRQSA